MREKPNTYTDGAVRSQREVAEILGISPQAVAEVERRALGKLRAALVTRPATGNETRAWQSSATLGEKYF